MEHHLSVTIARLGQAVCEEECTVTVTRTAPSEFLVAGRSPEGPVIITAKFDNRWLVKAGRDEWLPLDNTAIIQYIEGISQ